MSDDTYNGWKNRETWAFCLHVNNDQGLYNETLALARGYIEETYGKAGYLIHDEDERRAAYYGAAEHVARHWENTVEELEDEGQEVPSVLRAMRNEVGSWWRIDYRDVAENLREADAAEGGE